MVRNRRTTPERRKSGSIRRARAPWSVWRRCSLVTGRREHVRRSRLAVQTEALSRDMPEYLNRLLTRWAPAGALCAQAARRQHSREKVRGATERGWNSPGARVVYISGYQSTAAFEVFVNRIPFTVEEHYKAFYLDGRTVSQNASDAKNCRRTGGSILLQSKRGKSATAGSKSGALRLLRCQAPLALPTQIFCSTLCFEISSVSE